MVDYVQIPHFAQVHVLFYSHHILGSATSRYTLVAYRDSPSARTKLLP